MADGSFNVKFEGKDFDIKSFIRYHPGGVNTLKHYEGRSVKDAMRKFEHNPGAYHMLKDFGVPETVDSNLTGSVSANGRIITKEEDGMDHEEIAFLEELESRLDWSKPLLEQLHKIAPHYDKWVNSAVYRQCILLGNPVLDTMLKTPWYLVPLVWIPVILLMGYTQVMEHVYCAETCSHHPLTLVEFIGHVATGMFVWSLLEYALHRWVFHVDPGSSMFMIKLHFFIHGIHHKVPFDDMRQVFPPIPAFLMTCIIYQIVRLVFTYPLIEFTGGLIGYLVYDMIHFYVHHGSPAVGSYLYEMKRYHSNHHFINHDKAFGISSKFWDQIFRTVVKLKKLSFGLQW